MAAPTPDPSSIEPKARERLVKSDERVRDLGEVFTPLAMVDEMLDLLPREMWAAHPSRTYLEPSCGDGNFLVAILERKLRSIDESLELDRRTFFGLAALSSIYGIDISRENIVGRVPGHEVGARERLLSGFLAWASAQANYAPEEASSIRNCASWIISHNVLVGNMLVTDQRRRPSGRDHIPILAYDWEPELECLSVGRTTMGNIILSADATIRDMLWGAPEPVDHWHGHYLELAGAPRVRNPFDEVAALAGS
jgi:hypothetical protein